MQTIIVRVASVVCVIVALIGIKMMNLPELITSILVIILMGFIIFNVVIFPGKKKHTPGTIEPESRLRG